MWQCLYCGSILRRISRPLFLPCNDTIDLFLLQEMSFLPSALHVVSPIELCNEHGGWSYPEDVNVKVINWPLLLIKMCLLHMSQFVITKYTMLLRLYPGAPILMQRKAYVDLWFSCQIGDKYIDLSIHLFDTYTTSKVNAAPPLNSNLTPRDDHTRSLPYANASAFQQWLHEEHGLQ